MHHTSMYGLPAVGKLSIANEPGLITGYKVSLNHKPTAAEQYFFL
jgi:hypothetical protein